MSALRPMVDPAKDAGLGVGHIWTAIECPAYTTLVGADCTCGGPRRRSNSIPRD